MGEGKDRAVCTEGKGGAGDIVSAKHIVISILGIQIVYHGLGSLKQLIPFGLDRILVRIVGRVA